MVVGVLGVGGFWPYNINRLQSSNSSAEFASPWPYTISHFNFSLWRRRQITVFLFRMHAARVGSGGTWYAI